MSGDAHHRDVVGADGNGIAGLREALEQRHHIATDGVGTLEVVEVEDLSSLGKRHRAKEEELPLWRWSNGCLVAAIKLVADGANDLFEGVIEKDQPDRRPMLIDNHCAAALRRLKPDDQPRQRLGLRNKDGWSRELVKGRRAFVLVDQRGQHVFGMDDAHDRVEVFGAQRESRMAALADGLEVLLARLIEAESDDIDTRHEDVSYLEVDEAEDVLGEFALPQGEVALLGAPGDDGADLGHVMGGLLSSAGLDADRSQQQVGGCVDQGDERLEDQYKNVDWVGDRKGHLVGGVDRPDLGRLFAEDHVEHGHDNEREGERDNMEHSFGEVHPERLENESEQTRYGWLCEPAEDQTRSRDPELAARQVELEVVEDVLGHLGSLVSLLGENADPSSSGLDEGELRRDEEPVDGDEDRCQGQRQPDSVHCSPLGGYPRSELRDAQLAPPLPLPEPETKVVTSVVQRGAVYGAAMEGRSTRDWWVPSFFGATMAVVMFSTTFVVHIKADDIWWHLASGELIVASSSLPDSNTFSFTAPDHPWLLHGWLSEVLFYLVADSLGELWLVLLGVILNGATCGVIFAMARRACSSPLVAAAVTMISAVLMMGNFSLRPYLFGNLLLATTVLLVESPKFGRRYRPVFVALLFMVWANLHGSYHLGLCVVLCGLVVTLITGADGQERRGRKELRTRAVDLGVALAACVATPYHLRGVLFPLTYARHLLVGDVSFLNVVSEWQRVGLATPLGVVIVGGICCATLVVVVSKERPTLLHVVLALGGSALALAAIRNTPLFGIAMAPLLARHLPLALGRGWSALRSRLAGAVTLERRHQRWAAIDRRSIGVVLPVASLVVLIIAFTLPRSSPLSYSSLAGVQELSDLSPASFPRDAIASLEGRQRGFRIFNHYDWGGALIWAHSPERQVFIDQRNDCYPQRVFRDYLNVHRLESGGVEILERWQVDIVIYPPGSALAEELRRDPRWRLDFEDEQAIVFERRR